MNLDQMTTQLYRETFSKGAGREVLKDMLVRLHFFSKDVQTPEEVARRNFAAELLQIMGSLDVNKSNEVVDNVVRGLCNVPLGDEKKAE